MKKKRPATCTLDEYQVEEIKNLLSLGKKERDIATIYKCKVGDIYKIKQEMNDQQAEQQKNTVEVGIVNIDDLIPLPVKEETTSDDTSKEEETKIKRKRITAAEKESICKDLRKGITAAVIAEKYNISTSSVFRIKSEYKMAYAKTLKESSVKQQQLFDPNKLVRIQNGSYVKLGLVADRHDIRPVDTYIFETFDPDLMFNYEKQDQMAKEVLLKKIPFSYGKPLKGLMLYVTGLQSALVSVIKACQELKIPLIVMHHNSDDDSYMPQYYTDDNKEDIVSKIPAVLENYIKRVRTVQLYNCRAEDLVEAKELFEIRECTYDALPGSITRQVIATDTIIFINKFAAWEYFRLKAEEAEPKKSVFINTACIDDKGRFSSGKSIARITN